MALRIRASSCLWAVAIKRGHQHGRLANLSILSPGSGTFSWKNQREHPKVDCVGPRRLLSSTSSTGTSSRTDEDLAKKNEKKDLTRMNDDSNGKRNSTDDNVLYQSPFGSLVTRLRSVSLLTALVGTLGMPAMLLLKGDLPSVAGLAAGSTFVLGSVGSTAAIHFVFSPYVYTIERIPKELSQHGEESANEENAESQPAESPTTVNDKDVMIKCTSKSLFLQSIETVFDPATDIEPYTGMRPICNFSIQGVPLYVHPEYVHDTVLREAMKLDGDSSALKKENPDDSLRGE